MGQEFAFVFDIIVAVVIIGMTFIGIKKGFARVLTEMLSIAAAFLLAFAASGPIADGIYKNFIENPVEEAVDEAIGSTEELVGINPFEGADIDYSKVEISGVPVSEVEPDYEGTGSAVMDLSDVDLSETGIDKLDLSLFGVDEDTDFSSVNAKTANFSMTDIEQYGLGKLVTAQYLAACMAKGAIADTIGDVVNAVSDVIPIIFTESSTDIVNVSSVRKIILAMIDTEASVKTSLMDGIISPSCTVIIRSAAAILLFILLMVIFGLIARGAGLINKVPVIGKVNSLFGGVLGFVEAVIIVELLCLATRLISSMFNGEVILFNDTAINSTILFGKIYNTDFLNF